MTRLISHPLFGLVLAGLAVTQSPARAADAVVPKPDAAAAKPAADPARTTEAAKPTTDKAKPATPAPPAKPVPAAGGTSAVVMDLSSIESVIGRSVKSSAGEDMGRIVDLLVTSSGQVRAAVIDFGGILGVGSRKVAVDWKALDFGELAKGGDIRLALTRNQVRVSPEYKPNDPVVILEATKPEEKPEASKASAPVSPTAPAAAKPEPPKISAPQDTPSTK